MIHFSKLRSSVVRYANKFSLDENVACILGESMTSHSRVVCLKELWQEFGNRDKMLSEFCSESSSTRLGHISTSLQFLKDHNVVSHGLLHFKESSKRWCVSRDFERAAGFGECILRNEISTRILAAMPNIDEASFYELCRRSVSPHQTQKLYDSMHLNRLLQKERRRFKLNEFHKHSMLLAILGEMQWFTLRTKATERTLNNALFPPSDVLILHALCAHAIEGIIVEAILNQLHEAIRILKDSWRNFHCSTVQQLKMKPRTINRLSLATVAVKREMMATAMPVTLPLSNSMAKMVTISTAPLPEKVKSAPPIHMEKHLDHRLALKLGEKQRQTNVDPIRMPESRRLELIGLA